MFTATRTDALARLEAFVPAAGRAYAANRNHYPDTTSGLSPAIRRRLISEAEVADRALGAHSFSSCEKFVQEICWRTYWVGWLEHRPVIWTRWLADVDRLTDALGADRSLQRRYAEAVGARTGIDCFDAWVTELAETGWLHNHARMNFASIWIFTLKLPWQLGAELFYRQLLDACPASNTLSWRWVAGLQTAGKTYLARADIIRSNSGGRFSVDAPLARAGEPLPRDDIPAPSALRRREHFDPALRTGHFVTTADLSLETQSLPRIVAVGATTRIGGDPADLKRAFAETALADGLARAAASAGCDADRLDEENPVPAIREWAARHCLQQIVTAEAATGPVADRLEVLASSLAADNIRLVRIRREWDAAAWPLATKGFFAFKVAIPKLLALA